MCLLFHRRWLLNTIAVHLLFFFLPTFNFYIILINFHPFFSVLLCKTDCILLPLTSLNYYLTDKVFTHRASDERLIGCMGNLYCHLVIYSWIQDVRCFSLTNIHRKLAAQKGFATTQNFYRPIHFTQLYTCSRQASESLFIFDEISFFNPEIIFNFFFTTILLQTM